MVRKAIFNCNFQSKLMSCVYSQISRIVFSVPNSQVQLCLLLLIIFLSIIWLKLIQFQSASSRRKKKFWKLQSITYCHFSGETKLASVLNSGVPTAFGKDLPVKQVKRRGFSTTSYLLQGIEEHGFRKRQEINLSTRRTDLHDESTHFQNIHKFFPLQLGLWQDTT